MITRLLFALARLAFGAKFAKDGYENLRDRDEMVAYADSVGVPAPELLVPAASGLLLVGGVLVAAGLAPVLGVVAIATFMLGVTPQMHDFWNRDDEESRTEERDAFLRNASFLGAAIAFAVAARERRAGASDEATADDAA
ncbi:DoxX family membrane protein [Halobaculum lipolyticum]|uniref:DoxX family membrane protein n=1 Tax=Halobaculum lipolyticum TaxID=3032001 RepID=A0ABD5W8X0_9EURY|nr:DoxX family membrane protein [Halobaculum sp. DT31]